MKTLQLFLLVLANIAFGQKIESIQLFNPQTNDETPVINFNQQLVLSFDDFSNSSTIYRYTIKHYNRNWEDDNLFFTEIATGNMSNLLDKFEYSFNTLQAYTHYKLVFPNANLTPKISGNFKIIVYQDSVDKPLFTRKFYVVEDGSNVGLTISRITDPTNPNVNQRVQVQVTSKGANLTSNVNSMTLNVMQNNNSNLMVKGLKPSSTLGSELLFQQMSLTFPGNNEFYYFDNKNIKLATDAVRATAIEDNHNQTYLYPVWAYPLDYQYQPDVNGAWYYRRSDLGIERNADKEGDYAWVYFYLDSEPIDKNIYVLGGFNDYVADKKSQMTYDGKTHQYVAKIYLKQGFYSYILATKNANGTLNFGEINGNFWQTENMYQAFLYYTPFGRYYDGLMGYGEFRTPIR